MIARADIRRRLSAVFVLALVVGLVGAVSLATVAGARRTSASLGAFEQQSRSADVELNVIGLPTRTQLDRLSDVSGVEAIGGLRAFGIVLPRAGGGLEVVVVSSTTTEVRVVDAFGNREVLRFPVTAGGMVRKTLP